MLFNDARLVAELFPLVDPRGRNVAVIISKATYALVHGGLRPVDSPQSFYMKDVYDELDHGEKKMRLASDLTDFKPATDVLVARPPGELRRHPVAERRLKIEIGGLEFSGTATSPWPFGPVARDESPRKRHAGTYDSMWAAERMPLLPLDFDPRFNQVAPPRQIISPYLRGFERVRLTGFGVDREVLETRLPGRLVLIAVNASGRYFTQPALLDTVVLHLDPPLLEMVWRLSIPTRRSIDEVRYVWVYYPTLRSYHEVYGSDRRASPVENRFN